MLKLKDIFNIDISSKGGGAKLYKKIMRKYNIPIKDVKEVKQEIVECSQGGGEESGGKLTYYRFPSYASLDEVPDTDIIVAYNAARIRSEFSGMAQIGVTFIGGGNFREDNILGVRAFAVDKRARCIMVVGGQKIADVTLEEYLAQSGVSFNNYEEITEEEFYNLNVN